jgi:hypothetical protein
VRGVFSLVFNHALGHRFEPAVHLEDFSIEQWLAMFVE